MIFPICDECEEEIHDEDFILMTRRGGMQEYYCNQCIETMRISLDIWNFENEIEESED